MDIETVARMLRLGVESAFKAATNMELGLSQTTRPVKQMAAVSRKFVHRNQLSHLGLYNQNCGQKEAF